MKIFHRYLPYLFAIFLFLYCWNVYWGGKRYQGFFLSDSNGYYAYLPAVFIYHDLDFKFIDDLQKKEYPDYSNFDFRKESKVPNIDKWYCGTAVAISPFFLLGHLITRLTGNEPTGYSFWYAWALNISALFYCLIGLLALRKILRKFFPGEGLISFILFLTLFGTNLFFYATSEPAMSHVYSFALVNLFVLSLFRYKEKPKGRGLLILAALLGLIMITRPVNGLVVLLIPFVAGSKEQTKQFFRSLRRQIPALIAGSVLFLAILSVQFSYYYIKAGQLVLYSYGNETFNFIKPHLTDFLFSYKKGLFIYLPLTFISLFGFIFLYRKNRWQFYTLLVFLVLLVYILASWWNWWFGGSFGTRPLVEFLFIFAILTGFVLNSLRGLAKKGVVTLCLLCFLLCQVQTYQYRYYHIHWDRMDKAHYWNVFMRIDLLATKVNPNQDLLQ